MNDNATPFTTRYFELQTPPAVNGDNWLEVALADSGAASAGDIVIDEIEVSRGQRRRHTAEEMAGEGEFVDVAADTFRLPNSEVVMTGIWNSPSGSCELGT